MQSSLALLKIPLRRFEKVTCRLLSLVIFFISIFLRPLPFLAVDMTEAQKGEKRKRKGSMCE
jgi:hypothetical protein